MTAQEARQALSARGIPFEEERVFPYVEAGNEETVKLFLVAGLASTTRNSNGESVVVVAARNGHKDLVRTLLEAGADPLDLVPDVQRRATLRDRKDVWEKLTSLSAVFTLVSTLVVAGVGWYFTDSYNKQQAEANRLQQERDADIRKHQNRITEMQTIEKMIPHLVRDEQGKKAALLAINILATPELATKMAESFGGRGSIEALETIATKTQGDQRPLAVSALTSLATGGGSDAGAALAALGQVFAGKEKALATVLGGGQPRCSGFMLRGKAAKTVWVATADYCAEGMAPGELTIQTWDKRQLRVTKIEQRAPFGLAFLGVEGDGLEALKIAGGRLAIGDRLAAIAYESPLGSAASWRLLVVVGTVKARPSARVAVVRFERKIGMARGSSGGPMLDSNGEVACMMSKQGPDAEYEDECIASEALRNGFAGLG